MAISLYRKYRPQTFDQVVGQEHIEQTLRNAVAEGNVSHAYLFCGPRGTGKTTTARLLAKALICEKGPTPDPCGECSQCKQVAAGTHPDVYELDAASRTGVDNVREEIIGRMAFAPTSGRYKIYIIDEVHMLSIAAFNALLKTLEEPPSHVVFILCTTDPHKVPDTIVSRCQRFDFHRISIPDIVGNLRLIADKENIKVDDVALEMIARNSLGGMRDAITTFEQLAVFTEGDITVEAAEELLGEVQQTQLSEICGLIATRDLPGCFSWVASFVEGGTDIASFVHDLTAYVRDLYVVTLTGNGTGIEGLGPDDLAILKERAGLFEGPERLARILLILSDLNTSLRTATDPRLCLEIALTRMAYPTSDLTLESLAERVESLERNVADLQLGTAGAPRIRQGGASGGASGGGAGSAPAPAQPAAANTPARRKAPVKQGAAPAAPAQEVAPATGPEASNPSPAPASSPEKAPAAAAPASAAAAPAPAASQVAAPRASGESPADSTPAPLDQPTVTRRWAEASRLIGNRRKSLAGTISGIRAFALDTGDGIMLELPRGSMFSKHMLEEPENHQIIESAIEKAFGRRVRYVLTISESAPDEPPAMPIEDRPSTDLFGGGAGAADSTAAPATEAPRPETPTPAAEAPRPEPPTPAPEVSQPEAQAPEASRSKTTSPAPAAAAAKPAPPAPEDLPPEDEYVYEDDEEYDPDSEYLPDAGDTDMGAGGNTFAAQTGGPVGGAGAPAGRPDGPAGTTDVAGATGAAAATGDAGTTGATAASAAAADGAATDAAATGAAASPAESADDQLPDDLANLIYGSFEKAGYGADEGLSDNGGNAEDGQPAEDDS